MALLGVNAIWEFSEYALGLYLIGVFWHVMQAAILFVLLIWITESHIEQE